MTSCLPRHGKLGLVMVSSSGIHIHWNGQAVSYPALPLVTNVCVNSKKKPPKKFSTEPKSSIKSLHFCLTGRDKLYLGLLRKQGLYDYSACPPGHHNYWVHEQTSAQLSSHSVFYISKLVLHTWKPGLITVSLTCPDFMVGTSPYISWDKPRAEQIWRIFGFINSAAFCGVGKEMWLGIKYCVFGEALEMACKANPPLCRVP